MNKTPLDHAHRAMTQAPEDDQSRLSFFGHLASAELFLFLEQEVSGDKILPRIFNTEDGDFVLAFDREDRLAEFDIGGWKCGILICYDNNVIENVRATTLRRGLDCVTYQ